VIDKRRKKTHLEQQDSPKKQPKKIAAVGAATWTSKCGGGVELNHRNTVNRMQKQQRQAQRRNSSTISR
jgi:hypothetical protein